MDATILDRLQAWYVAQRDGEWEHAHGVKIGTLDNPGWSVEIDLVGTELVGRPFAEVKDDYEHETDWMVCRKKGATFVGACGPTRLEDVLRVFLDWV